MEWKNKAFKYKDIAEITKKELDKAGINTGDVFHTGDGFWYVPWMATTKEQEQKAIKIIVRHIW